MIAELVTTRTLALMMPFFLTAAVYVLLLLFALPRLHNSAIQNARASADSQAVEAPDSP
jgi:hypothetical protein